jgi:hypothetical protein
VPLTRHHATAFLGLPADHAVEELRRTWDPEMAKQIAAHVTLIYPEEIPGPAQLAASAGHAAARTAPFAITLGALFHDGSPASGVFLHVGDPANGISRFRSAASLAAQGIDFPPHVALVHPRTSRRGPQAWAALADVYLALRITITQIAITAYDGDRWPTLRTISLTGSRPL